MNSNIAKIVTLIPSATEIVAFLGQKNSIVGRSHECDYPKDLNNIAKLTSPKINVDGISSEINKQINTILENSLSVYKVDVEKLKKLNPDFIRLCLNHTLAEEITLQPIKRFGFDAAIIFSDILMVPYGLNQKIKFKKISYC